MVRLLPYNTIYCYHGMPTPGRSRNLWPIKRSRGHPTYTVKPSNESRVVTDAEFEPPPFEEPIGDETFVDDNFLLTTLSCGKQKK